MSRVIIEHVDRPILVPTRRQTSVSTQVHGEAKAAVSAASRLVGLQDGLGCKVPHVYSAFMGCAGHVVLIRAERDGPGISNAPGLRLRWSDLVVEREVAAVWI